MANRSIIVIDNFYDEPDEVRRLALSLKYRRKPGATYPGKEAMALGHDWIDVRARLRAHIDEACDAPCPKKLPFPQGKFRCAIATDERRRIDRVHVDQQRWSGIIYLTLPQHCREGISLYRHRPTGSTEWPEDWFRKHYAHLYRMPPAEFRERVLRFFRDPRQFERIGLIPMAYNRAILLMAHALHGTGCVFGTNRRNGRLTQHFEFYAP